MRYVVPNGVRDPDGVAGCVVRRLHECPGVLSGAYNRGVNPLLARGIELFDAGRELEAHELWEERWREIGEGDERVLLGALVQLAAARIQAGRGRERGARSLLGKAAAKLGSLPSRVAGLDVAGLRQDLADFDRVELSRRRCE